MSRYKGRASSRAIEKDFPHIVETIVPLGGFGKTLDAMLEFHSRKGIRAIIQPDDAMRMAAITSGGALLIGRQPWRSPRGSTHLSEDNSKPMPGRDFHSAGEFAI